jgi:hypothetical protein
MRDTKLNVPLDKDKPIVSMTIEELARVLNAVVYVAVKDAIMDSADEQKAEAVGDSWAGP